MNPDVAGRAIATQAFSGWRRLCGMRVELAAAARETADIRSRCRLILDIVLFRVLRLWPTLGRNARTREIRLRSGRLSYRLNRGDIQGIREVWLDEIYRMPPPHVFRTVVDLGMNIGLTSAWLGRMYGVELIVGVEPDSANVALALRNLEVNNVDGRILCAAVGPRDGETCLSLIAGASNLGTTGSVGERIRMISMKTVLEEIPSGRQVDLLKLDIEGGEAGLLLADDLDWLHRIDAIIAEFHPEMVDIEDLVSVLRRHGFDYLPAGSLWAGSMDIFRRPSGV